MKTQLTVVLDTDKIRLPKTEQAWRSVLTHIVSLIENEETSTGFGVRVIRDGNTINPDQRFLYAWKLEHLEEGDNDNSI
jgi:hypothetical protein